MGTPAVGRLSTFEIETAVGPPLVYTAVAGSRDLTLAISRETADSTSRDSLGWKEVLATNATADISGDLLYEEDDAGQEQLQLLVFSGAKVSCRFRPLGLGVGNDEWVAQCLITKADISSPHEDVMTLGVEVKISGVPVRATQ